MLSVLSGAIARYIVKVLQARQLHSKANAFQLGCKIPCGELTHDTKEVVDADKCYNVQQCMCLDADL